MITKRNMLLLVLLSIELNANCGCSGRDPVYTPDPAMSRLEQRSEDASKEILRIQGKVKALLDEMVVTIQKEGIDTSTEVKKVEQTKEEVRRLIRKLQNLRGIPTSTRGTEA